MLGAIIGIAFLLAICAIIYFGIGFFMWVYVIPRNIIRKRREKAALREAAHKAELARKVNLV